MERIKPVTMPDQLLVPGGVGGGGRLPTLFRDAVQLKLPMKMPVQRRGITAYHGSTEPNLKELSGKKAVETPNTTWHTSEPDVASTFTVPREYGEPVWDHPNPGRVYQTQLAPRNPLELRGKAAQDFSDYNSPQVIEAARRKAHDMIIARDVNEGIGNPQKSDVYAVLNDAIAQIIKAMRR
jgi:hypothetical protein